MLMPPFTDEQPAVLEAWLGYQQGAARASGGLAPGTDWWLFAIERGVSATR
jgi:hypothetical protein